MEKKLQIFISSTFTDLKDERQAGVISILSAGHIPAGMELFSAGNESQMDVIKRWIDDSDVYLLIFGGRYGTIEAKTQKSYIQLEFEYAVSKNIPLFSLVISDQYLDRKVKETGKSVLELDHPDKYQDFKKIVTSKVVEFFNDTKDIQIAIHKTLRDFEKRFEFEGWVSGKNLTDNTELIKQNSEILTENRNLKEKIEYLNTKISDESKSLIDAETAQILNSTIVTIPEHLKHEFSNRLEDSIFNIIITKKLFIARGITNARNASDIELFFLHNIVPQLLVLGLMREKNLYGKSFERYVLTEAGTEFLRKNRKN